MSGLALQTGPQRQRRRKHSFQQLPGGAISGSSTNPETVGRNRRRQNLSPLKAALERVRANKAGRISRRIHVLRRLPGWEGTSDEDKEAALKAIRDEEQARYEKDRSEVDKQYQAEVEAEALSAPPGKPPPASPAVNDVTQPPTPTPLGSEGSPSGPEFGGIIVGGGGGGSRSETTEGGRGNSGEKSGSEAEASENDENETDSPDGLAKHLAYLVERTSQVRGHMGRLLDAFGESGEESSETPNIRRRRR